MYNAISEEYIGCIDSWYQALAEHRSFQEPLLQTALILCLPDLYLFFDDSNYPQLHLLENSSKAPATEVQLAEILNRGERWCFFHDTNATGCLIIGKQHGYSEHELLQALKPHLESIFTIYRKQRLLEKAVHDYINQFNRLQVGVLIINGNTDIVFVNDAFLRWIVQNNNELHLFNFSPAKAVESLKLRKPLKYNIECALKEVSHKKRSASILLNQHSKAADYYLQIFCMSHGEGITCLNQNQRYLCVLHRSDSLSVQSLGHFQAFYSLSNAESRLLSLLIQGYCLKDTARRANVAYETVRTQLKSIYLKTGMDSQPALLALVFATCCESPLCENTSNKLSTKQRTS